MNNLIAEKMHYIINEVLELRKQCKDLNLLNSQEYLNFEDKLNEISVMDPTI